MLKLRLIPVVLMRNGSCVQSKGFRRFQRLGDPVTIVRRLSDWASDELIYLDISDDESSEHDHADWEHENTGGPMEILEEISKSCFMPLTFGGKIRCLDDIGNRIASGADKISINSQPLIEPDFIDAAAKTFGSQCIVVSIDAKRTGDGKWEVFRAGGTIGTGRSPRDWAQEATARGAGEILIQSIDEDGKGQGYDLGLVADVARSVRVPVIALGGVGQWEHFAPAIEEAGADAMAAANIFNYSENSVFHAKQHLFESGVNVREPLFGYSL